MSRLKPHLQTPATWISLLALFIALGGTAYAAVKITGKEVVNSSLTGADIKNGSIGSADLSAAAKKTLTGPTGPTGAAGPAGAAGAAGANGTNGTNGSAVAFGGLSSDGSSCAIDTARIFNIPSSCSRSSAGVYAIAGVSVGDLNGRVGTCSVRTSNSGTAGICAMRFPSSTSVEIRTFNDAGVPTDFGTGAWFAIY